MRVQTQLSTPETYDIVELYSTAYQWFMQILCRCTMFTYQLDTESLMTVKSVKPIQSHVKLCDWLYNNIMLSVSTADNVWDSSSDLHIFLLKGQ